ncbi:MAG: R2-like ligand-binding oxidase [Caldilineales bacterium]|nr:R2-like ligand-binding oxidase [Caldilineales bacterium]MCW5859236.1 R2-like ligand-binding oxidase [Caldilineales bacterium]
MNHETFTTTSAGLNRQHPALRLFEKAKRLGVWNPSDLDFGQDARDWQRLAADERDILLRLTSLFAAGEEAVTLDLLPLMRVIANEGRVEEAMYLTTFLWEEAKHTDFFDRFLREVAGVQASDLGRYHTANYRTIVYQALPAALSRLDADPSPAAQVAASITYNMIVEGVLAETGYHAYFTVLDQEGILPGQRRGVAHLKQDESRHIAYGVFLLARLLAEDGRLWEVVDTAMNDLLIPALGVVTDAFDAYDPVPFGLSEDVFIDYATGQFEKRMQRLEKARGLALREVVAMTQAYIDQDDA